MVAHVPAELELDPGAVSRAIADRQRPLRLAVIGYRAAGIAQELVGRRSVFEHICSYEIEIRAFGYRLRRFQP